MSRPAIRVEGLGKMYRIGGAVERYKTLRDSLTHAVTGVGRRLRGIHWGDNGTGPAYETIWALKDVAFEVQPGEVVGIIGRNGAGKSTLLKILSRITEPTEGRVEIRGRVGSLLEVGTGFHPELSGRENVYLNGAILGMKRAEVDRKFDEIVAFAEVEKFIDTPVKHYSSGMYVRLAFSVAAHLDTDILLVDEVLSVGDVKFQQKCLGKMQDRAFADKTILFVSHNLAMISQFCNRGLLLAQGFLQADGLAEEIVGTYLGEEESAAIRDLSSARRRSRTGVQWNYLKRVVLSTGGHQTQVYSIGDAWEMLVECGISEEDIGRQLCLAFDIRDALGHRVLAASTDQYGCSPTASGVRHYFRAGLSSLPLAPGRYHVSLFLGDGHRDYEIIDNAISFHVTWKGVSDLPLPPKAGWGPLFLPLKWQTWPYDRSTVG